MPVKDGRSVKVYIDPITRKSLEGEAILISKDNSYADWEYWTVEFPDGAVVKRFINPDDIG